MNTGNVTMWLCPSRFYRDNRASKGVMNVDSRLKIAGMTTLTNKLFFTFLLSLVKKMYLRR